MNLSHNQKEAAIEAIREHGTLKAGALAAGVDVKTFRAERKRSTVFERRVGEALDDGKEGRVDYSLQDLYDIAGGKLDVKMPQLTAILAILNWGKPGFKGSTTTTIQGNVNHNVIVRTGVPRPKYAVEAPGSKILDEQRAYDRKEKDQIKRLNRGETVEEVIEGEVVAESEG